MNLNLTSHPSPVLHLVVDKSVEHLASRLRRRISLLLGCTRISAHSPPERGWPGLFYLDDNPINTLARHQHHGVLTALAKRRQSKETSSNAGYIANTSRNAVL
jgi:hypothetical protein